MIGGRRRFLPVLGHSHLLCDAALDLAEIAERVHVVVCPIVRDPQGWLPKGIPDLRIEIAVVASRWKARSLVMHAVEPPEAADEPILEFVTPAWQVGREVVGRFDRLGVAGETRERRSPEHAVV